MIQKSSVGSRIIRASFPFPGIKKRSNPTFFSEPFHFNYLTSQSSLIIRWKLPWFRQFKWYLESRREYRFDLTWPPTLAVFELRGMLPSNLPRTDAVPFALWRRLKEMWPSELRFWASLKGRDRFDLNDPAAWEGSATLEFPPPSIGAVFPFMKAKEYLIESPKNRKLCRRFP